MFKEDGDKIAELIYQRLIEKDNRELNIYEILDIYDSYEYPVLRKTEFYIWDNLNKRSDIERFMDEKEKPYIRLKN